jgi:hypothetical protein
MAAAKAPPPKTGRVLFVTLDAVRDDGKLDGHQEVAFVRFRQLLQEVKEVLEPILQISFGRKLQLIKDNGF